MFSTTITNIWGCVLSCDDKLIIEELKDKNSDKLYYRIYETSHDLNKIPVYEESSLPSILNEIIYRCECTVKFNKASKKHILYGPHIINCTINHPIYQYEEDYFSKEHLIKPTKDNQKIKHFYDWLIKLLHPL